MLLSNRTVAGQRANLESYVRLLEAQMAEDGALRERVRASGLTSEEWITHCNPHLVPPGESRPAVAVHCLDINR